MRGALIVRPVTSQMQLLDTLMLLQANHRTTPELRIAAAIMAALHLKDPSSLCMGCSSLAATLRLLPHAANAVLAEQAWSQHRPQVASDLWQALQAAAPKAHGANRQSAAQQLLLNTSVCFARQDLVRWEVVDWTMWSLNQFYSLSWDLCTDPSDYLHVLS